MTQEAWRPSEQPVAYMSRSVVMWLTDRRRGKAANVTTTLDVTQQCESDVAIFTTAQLAAEVQRAVEAERERCASVADDLQQQWRPAGEVADAIRKPPAVTTTPKG